MKATKTKLFNLRMPVLLKKQIEKKCKKEFVNMSTYIITLITKDINNNN